MTVLFADLVGFTSRAELMDPEDAGTRSPLRSESRLCPPFSAAISRAGGRALLDCARVGRLTGGGPQGEIDVPVDELLVVVNAPVDAGDPQGHGMPRAEDGPGAVRYQGGPGTTSVRVICHTLT